MGLGDLRLSAEPCRRDSWNSGREARQRLVHHRADAVPLGQRHHLIPVERDAQRVSDRVRWVRRSAAP